MLSITENILENRRKNIELTEKYTVTNLKSDLFKNISGGDYMYLVHSFYAENCEQSIATSDYDIEYASALENENFFGVQFHPEKSSMVGAQLLQNFLDL